MSSSTGICGKETWFWLFVNIILLMVNVTGIKSTVFSVMVKASLKKTEKAGHLYCT